MCPPRLDGTRKPIAILADHGRLTPPTMSYTPAVVGPVGTTVRANGTQFLSEGPRAGSASVGVMGPTLFSAKVSLRSRRRRLGTGLKRTFLRMVNCREKKEAHFLIGA
jgi:hypothetical protein